MSKHRVVGALLLALASGAFLGAQEGRGPQGFLGIAVGPEGEAKGGIRIRDVLPDSPAAKAGLKSSDVLVKLNDQKMTDGDSFFRAIAGKKPGDKVTCVVHRDGKDQTLTATLGETPRRPGGPTEPLRRPPVRGGGVFLGVGTEDLTPELKKSLNLHADSGVIVGEVVTNSPADKAGLKRNDVITAVDGKAVKTLDDLREALRKAGPGKEVTLQVMRGKEKQTLKATPRERPGGIRITPRGDGVPSGIEVPFDLPGGSRIRELERRIEELEKRLKKLEGSGKSEK